MANADQTAMWEQWMQALQEAIAPHGVGDNTVFSAGSMARAVNLNATDTGVTNAGIYALGDIIPANSPNYSPAPSGLAATYTQFLDWIDLGGDTNPNLQSQLNIAINGDGAATPGLNAVQAAFSNLYKDATTQYLADKSLADSVGDKLPPFKDWLATNYPSYGEAKRQLDGAQAQVDQLSAQLYGPGYQTVQRARMMTSILNGAQNPMEQNHFNMLITSATYIPPGSTSAVIGTGLDTPKPTSSTVSSYVPLYSLDPAYAATYKEWQTQSTSGKIGWTFTYQAKSTDYDYKQSGWNASAKVGWTSFLWSASASMDASGETQSTDVSTTDLSITVEFVGVKAIGISPGPWWDNGSLVSTYRDKLKPGAPDFFGDDGAMARRAFQVVLGFEPTITIGLSAADYSRVRSEWQAKASVSVGIGPFSFGGSGGANASKDDIHYDDASSSITIGPIKSTMPVLLGVVSSKL